MYCIISILIEETSMNNKLNKKIFLEIGQIND